MELSLRSLNYTLGLVVVLFFTYYIGTNKINYYKSQQYASNHPTTDEVTKRLNCLAINIYREAGHEPFEGKVAVAQVTINRSNDPRFPQDICGVVFQKNIIMEKVICQFSWYCDNIAKARPINNDAYKESYEVAKKVLLEGFRLDAVKDALYFHAVYVKPNWKHERVAKIGNHIFYSERIKI